MESNIFRHMSRRVLLETFLAAGSIPLLAESRPHAEAPGTMPDPSASIFRRHHRQNPQPRA